MLANGKHINISFLQQMIYNITKIIQFKIKVQGTY